MLELALSVVIFVAAVVASGHAVASKPADFSVDTFHFSTGFSMEKDCGRRGQTGESSAC